MNRLPKNPQAGGQPGLLGSPKTAPGAAFQAAPGELPQQLEELQRRVAERTAELENTVRTLEIFCHSIVHDLRAPLRAMHGFASLLLSHYTPVLDSRGQDYSRRICASAERMDQFLNDLLAFGRISSTRLPLHTVDTEALAKSTAADLLKAGAAGHIEIRPPLPPVQGNLTLLEHVLTHLLSNALKFVAPGVSPRARIWAEYKGQEPEDRSQEPGVRSQESGVRSQESGAGSQEPAATQHATRNTQHATRSLAPHSALPLVRLWVEDNGIGIPADLQASLFHAFERLHGDRYPGTGIGLAIVQKAVEQMQGAAGVDSEPGKGSRFWVELPAANA